METYKNQTTVFVENQMVHAPVGWFAEERASGVDLWISVFVGLQNIHSADDLEHSVDYAQIVFILIEESKNEYKLLETFGAAIITKVRALKEQDIHNIEVVIRKKSIPVANYNADAAGVKIIWEKP